MSNKSREVEMITKMRNSFEKFEKQTILFEDANPHIYIYMKELI